MTRLCGQQSIRCTMVDWAEDWCAIIDPHPAAEVDCRECPSSWRTANVSYVVGGRVPGQTLGPTDLRTRASQLMEGHCEQIVDGRSFLWLALTLTARESRRGEAESGEKRMTERRDDWWFLLAFHAAATADAISAQSLSSSMHSLNIIPTFWGKQLSVPLDVASFFHDYLSLLHRIPSGVAGFLVFATLDNNNRLSLIFIAFTFHCWNQSISGGIIIIIIIMCCITFVDKPLQRTFTTEHKEPA